MTTLTAPLPQSGLDNWINFTMHTKNEATTVETYIQNRAHAHHPAFDFGYRKSIYEHMGYVLWLLLFFLHSNHKFTYGYYTVLFGRSCIRFFWGMVSLTFLLLQSCNLVRLSLERQYDNR